MFDEDKNEIRVPITEVTDIYAHADQLRKTVAGYLQPVVAPASVPMS